MECLGGNGYIEQGPMPHLFRQSPLNAIWEGSGNVIALDVRRAFDRDGEAAGALRAFLEEARGREPLYDRHLDALPAAPPEEGAMRLYVEQLVLAATAATLLLWDHPASGTFAALRLAPRGACFGAFARDAADPEPLLARHLEALAAAGAAL